MVSLKSRSIDVLVNLFVSEKNGLRFLLPFPSLCTWNLDSKNSFVLEEILVFQLSFPLRTTDAT